jgi:hypothetical protein
MRQLWGAVPLIPCAGGLVEEGFTAQALHLLV